MDGNHRLLHGDKKLYRHGEGNELVSFQEIDVMRMNELLKTKFGAAEVAAKLLGAPQPTFMLYTSDSSTISLSFSGGMFHHEVESPAFLWKITKGMWNQTCFVLNSNETLALRYPITKINISRPPNKSKPNMTSIQINTDEELLDALDEVLSKM